MLLQVFGEGAQREGRKAQRERKKERQSGRWAAHALCPCHGAWVEEGSSDNSPSHRGALPTLKTLSHPPLETVQGEYGC